MGSLKHSHEEIKKAVRMKFTVMATAGLEQCEWESDSGKIAAAAHAGFSCRRRQTL